MAVFDGKTLDGWVQRGGKAKDRVEEGQIVGSAVPNTPNSFLCTRREYVDFVLELEFKVDPALNSGVQVRSQFAEEGKEVESAGKKIMGGPGSRVFGYQVEIDPSERTYTGGIYDEGRRGWLNNLKDNEAARKAFKANEWNTFKVPPPKGDPPPAPFFPTRVEEQWVLGFEQPHGTNMAPLVVTAATEKDGVTTVTVANVKHDGGRGQGFTADSRHRARPEQVT